MNQSLLLDVCDLCSSAELDTVYEVPGTARGLSIHVCTSCGLVQSLPRIDHVPRNAAFPDSGAGFGNIRYGKGFRTAFALEQLNKHIDLGSLKTCLDVGANRGSFLLALLDLAPSLRATAIEPDERVLDAYEGHEKIVLINERVENVNLGLDKFDLIYHCHTLEHQAHPVASLKAVCQSLTEEGVIYLEVPNIEFLKGDNIVEEWFIDKHLYHYSIGTLCASVIAAGFEIIQAPDKSDITNITVIAKRASVKAELHVPREGNTAKGLLKQYRATLSNNQEKLIVGAASLSKFCKSNRVAIWGAGRIYTSIVDVGGFDPSGLCAVVDKNLYKYVSEMFGVSVAHPEVLESARPDVVLVASRLYFDEIKQELLAIAPNAKVLTLDDVLAGEIGVKDVA